MCLSLPSFGQVEKDTIVQDTSIILESKISIIDSTKVDNNEILISEDSFDDEIIYDARDTNWTKVSESEVHLMGEAFVKYQDFEIKAGYIIFNYEKKEAVAEGIIDKDGNETQKPTVLVGGNTFQYNKLRYNFETKKGLIYGTRAQEGEMIIHGGVTKFVSQESDSLQHDDHIYNKDALVTTCDHDEPHYGIRTTKLKFIPKKLAILGPARVEIGGVPTPIFLPFAFFPMIKGQRSGLIFGNGQSFYELSDRLGFGFRDIGYYWYLNDYMDLQVTGDIYTRGTWRAKASTNYAKRYKYRGSFSMGYSSEVSEELGEINSFRDNSFSFNISHSQDSKAHPYRKLSGNFGFTTNDYNRNVNNDFSSQVNSTYSSNLSFSHTMPRFDAWRFTSSIRHSQNTRTGAISFTLPDINLTMNQIFPFKREKGGNKDAWYEKIGVRYGTKFRNKVSTIDSILFTKETLDEFQMGVQHEASANASFNLAKYFTFSPSVRYTENWNFKTNEKLFSDSLAFDTSYVDTDLLEISAIDTTFGFVEDNSSWGFTPYRTVTAGFNMSTALFGTMRFRRGRLKGLRHVLKPSVGFSYTPSTEGYGLEVRDDYFDEESTLEYSPFTESPFPVSNFSEEQMNFNYRFDNNFEAKYYSKKEEKDKKFKLFNTISFSGSHNFAADSLNWSPVSMRGNTNLFKTYSRLTINGTFSPYLEENNRTINKTVWGDSKKPLRFESFSLTTATGFTIRQLRDLFKSKKTEEKEDSKDRGNSDLESRGAFSQDQNEELESKDDNKKDMLSFWEIFDKFRIDHQFKWGVTQNDGINESRVTVNSIKVAGRFDITDTWAVNIGNISYDFIGKGFVYPSFGLEKDLHCWRMNFQWYPTNGTYNFFIGVKSTQLGSVLKYNYGQANGRRF